MLAFSLEGFFQPKDTNRFANCTASHIEHYLQVKIQRLKLVENAQEPIGYYFDETCVMWIEPTASRDQDCNFNEFSGPRVYEKSIPSLLKIVQYTSFQDAYESMNCIRSFLSKSCCIQNISKYYIIQYIAWFFFSGNQTWQ